MMVRNNEQTDPWKAGSSSCLIQLPRTALPGSSLCMSFPPWHWLSLKPSRDSSCSPFPWIVPAMSHDYRRLGNSVLLHLNPNPTTGPSSVGMGGNAAAFVPPRCVAKAVDLCRSSAKYLTCETMYQDKCQAPCMPQFLCLLQMGSMIFYCFGKLLTRV